MQETVVIDVFVTLAIAICHMWCGPRECYITCMLWAPSPEGFSSGRLHSFVLINSVFLFQSLLLCHWCTWFVTGFACGWAITAIIFLIRRWFRVSGVEALLAMGDFNNGLSAQYHYSLIRLIVLSSEYCLFPKALKWFWQWILASKGGKRNRRKFLPLIS